MAGMLIPVLVLAGIALVAVAPPVPNSSRPRHWTYLTGAFLLNELPFVALFWLAVWTLDPLLGGELGGAWGVAAGAALALAALEVLTIARRGFATRSALRALLDASCGPAGRSGAARSRLGRRHPWPRILFAPLPWRGRHIRRCANLAYGDAGRRHLLDVYHHRSRRGGPVLVYFHGGGFRSGHKHREALPLLHRLAQHGWVCLSANYRLSPEVGFPEHVIDAKRAVAWARRNAAAYGGDPDRLYVAGSSAGGHLALLCALAPNHPTFDRDTGGTDTTVAGAISLYGYIGGLDGPAAASSGPQDHLHPGAPPVFVAHGDLDTLVTVHDARAFARELGAVSSNPVVYAELRGAHHGFDLFHSARFEAVIDAVEDFVARTAAP
ncbi:MAG: alpha/beta hydrolase [Nocardioidaceae bacterium]|nr:alpha/beta hydrolase [Nocardioidaceae bacterium]